jgi:RNA polymerase sigma-70 factor (ECF subfamily)
LPQAQREIIALVDLVGFSYAETAELLGAPIGTVMSRISRARRTLLEAIGSSNVHEPPYER